MASRCYLKAPKQPKYLENVAGEPCRKMHACVGTCAWLKRGRNHFLRSYFRVNRLRKRGVCSTINGFNMGSNRFLGHVVGHVSQPCSWPAPPGRTSDCHPLRRASIASTGGRAPASPAASLFLHSPLRNLKHPMPIPKFK